MKQIFVAKLNAWFLTEQRGAAVAYHGPFYVHSAAAWYAAQRMSNRCLGTVQPY